MLGSLESLGSMYGFTESLCCHSTIVAAQDFVGTSSLATPEATLCGVSNTIALSTVGYMFVRPTLHQGLLIVLPSANSYVHLHVVYRYSPANIAFRLLFAYPHTTFSIIWMAYLLPVFNVRSVLGAEIRSSNAESVS